MYYAFPALLPDLQAATGWSVAELAFGPTLGFLVMAALTPFTGRWVDRGWGGEMLTYAPILAAVGVAGLGLRARPLIWGLIWAVIGVAQACCLYESCFAFLTRRLGEDARGAITKVTLVAGFAGTLAFPLGDWLGAALGGQGALFAFAALVLLGACRSTSGRCGSCGGRSGRRITQGPGKRHAWPGAAASGLLGDCGVFRAGLAEPRHSC